jgi:hypothetical protein
MTQELDALLLFTRPKVGETQALLHALMIRCLLMRPCKTSDRLTKVLPGKGKTAEPILR